MVRRKSIKHEVGGSGATPRWRIRDPALFACRQGKAWVDLAMGATPEPHPPSRSQAAATMRGLLTIKINIRLTYDIKL